MKETVSIIIVNYNGRKYLGPCLDSLTRADHGGFSPEIIMVDNLSKDDSVSLVRKRYPLVKILYNDVNNYTRALNLGIEQSQGDYIAILNNDTTVARNWLIGLRDVMDQDQMIGVVQSKILFSDGQTINSVGVEEAEEFHFRDIAIGQKDAGQYDEVREIMYFSGGSALLRRSCVESVGGFDEDFMFYVEDLDYSVRCRKKGWKIFYCPKSVVYHVFHGSTTIDFCEYFCSRNRLLFIAKHFPLKLPEGIKTSHFRHRNQYDALNHSVIQAIAKMVENHDILISRKVLDELKNVTVGLFKDDKAYNFPDYMLAHNRCFPTTGQRLIGAFQHKTRVPIMAFKCMTRAILTKIVPIVKLLIRNKADDK